MQLQDITIRSVHPSDELFFKQLMTKHHYLGALPKISNTIWYVATHQNVWQALMIFSAAALKCGARDQWIGWDFRHQYDRLNLLANNSRFLILPNCHKTNLASKVLSLCQKRIQRDWINRFGHPVLLLETFVDPTRFSGTIYKAANWHFAGYTKGYQRIRNGYSNEPDICKMVFVKPLQRNACNLLSRPILHKRYQTGGPRMKLTAQQMKSLPYFFQKITDPRREQGMRHRLKTVLSLSTAAVLCGMHGYKAISDWVKDLTPKAAQRFGCRYRNGKIIVPSESTIRNVLIRVDPQELDQALQEWNQTYGSIDESLAIDGKTMCNAIDETGRQVHIMSAVGHQSHQCYTQKKSVLCP